MDIRNTTKGSNTIEEIYLRLSRSGILALTLGIISVVFGIAAGTLGIVSGAKLLKAARRSLTL